MQTNRATMLLQRLDEGDAAAGDELYPLLYDELRRVARGVMASERVGHTLQPTALVHEAYLKLVDATAVRQGDRERFLRLAAWAMRQVLVDFARRRRAERRGGDDRERVSLAPGLLASEENGATPGSVDLLDLDDALTRLAERHEQAARVVELRFFGGLSIEESAAVLGVSPTTVKRDWLMAKAWLYRDMSVPRN